MLRIEVRIKNLSEDQVSEVTTFFDEGLLTGTMIPSVIENGLQPDENGERLFVAYSTNTDPIERLRTIDSKINCTASILVTELSEEQWEIEKQRMDEVVYETLSRLTKESGAKNQSTRDDHEKSHYFPTPIPRHRRSRRARRAAPLRRRQKARAARQG